MGFIQVNKEKVSKDVGGGNYLNKSGIFLVELKHIGIDTSKNGFVSANFGVEYEGNGTTLWGLGLFNKDGSENFGMATFQSLLTILDVEELDDPEEITIKTKDGTKDIMGYDGFEGTKVYVQVQMEHSLYNGKVQSTLRIKRFFRESDMATGSEIVNETEPKQYETALKYAEQDKYKDGVTEEDVANAKNEASTEKAEDKPKPNPFAKKK